MTNPIKSLAMARIITIALPLVLAVGALAGPVHAGSEPARVIVPYADLDLTSSAGQARLDRRLTHAIKRVCAVDRTHSVSAVSQERQCVEERRAEIAPVRDAVIAEARERAGQRELAQGTR
ncbi:MAG: UrcA family protein [Erythrobacter sp.]